MTGLIRSELLKVLTTRVWWGLLLGLVGLVGLSFALNAVTADFQLNPEVYDDNGNRIDAPVDLPGPDLPGIASNLYTSGQYFGTLLAMILGILLVTNEFYHQTATPTFLAAPTRSRVILAKLAVAVLWGVLFGLVTVAISLPAGLVYLNTQDVGSQLGNRQVVAGLLLNLLAFAIWGIFGLGLGTLLKNQIAAIIVALALKLIGELLLRGLFAVLSNALDWEWLENAFWYLPSAASDVMTSATRLEGAPPWWGGALILLAYGVVAAVLGTAITIRRDIT